MRCAGSLPSEAEAPRRRCSVPRCIDSRRKRRQLISSAVVPLAQILHPWQHTQIKVSASAASAASQSLGAPQGDVPRNGGWDGLNAQHPASNFGGSAQFGPAGAPAAACVPYNALAGSQINGYSTTFHQPPPPAAPYGFPGGGYPGGGYPGGGYPGGGYFGYPVQPTVLNSVFPAQPIRGSNFPYGWQGYPPPQQQPGYYPPHQPGPPGVVIRTETSASTSGGFRVRETRVCHQGVWYSWDSASGGWVVDAPHRSRSSSLSPAPMPIPMQQPPTSPTSFNNVSSF